MSAMIRMFTGRPVVIERDGWRVFVCVRDAAYLEGKREWRQKIAAAHPDSGGCHEVFILARAAFERWRETEAEWYSRLGLQPPDGWQPTHVTGLALKVDLICETCGLTFVMDRSHGQKNRRFCSLRCSNINGRRRRATPVITIGRDGQSA
jgi:hypothetical protein